MEIVTRDPHLRHGAAKSILGCPSSDGSAQGLMLEVDVADGCRHEKYASITLQQLARRWRNVCTGGRRKTSIMEWPNPHPVSGSVHGQIKGVGDGFNSCNALAADHGAEQGFRN